MTRPNTLDPCNSTPLSCGRLSKTLPPPRNQLVNNSYEKTTCKTENIYGVYREGLRRGYDAVPVGSSVQSQVIMVQLLTYPSRMSAGIGSRLRMAGLGSGTRDPTGTAS